MSDQDIDGFESADEGHHEIGYVDDLFDDDYAEGRQIETSEVDNPIWLVKVPDYLAQAWDKALAEGKEMALLKNYPSLVIPEGSSLATKHILHLPEEFSKIPRDFILTLNNSKSEKTLVFEADDNKVGTKILGTVTEEFTATAIQTETSHRNLLREISKSKGESNRQITFDTENVVRPSVNLNIKRPRDGDTWGGLGSKKKTSNVPKTTKTKDALRDELFALFKEYRFWSLKGLSQNTGQTKEELKDILKEIAVHHSKGKYHTLYQLKAEYGKNITPKHEIADDGADSDKEGELVDFDGAEDSYAVDENDEDEFEEVDE